MQVLSLLADIQIFALLELWPITKDVTAARWLERLRVASGGAVEARDMRLGIDHTWMFESSDPETKCCDVDAKQDTAWRWEVGVDTCLPVHI